MGSYLDSLKRGVRRHKHPGQYRKGVPAAPSPGEYTERPEKIYVYEWDPEQQKHIGHLVDFEEYYSS